MNNRSTLKGKLSSAFKADEIVLPVWTIDRSKPGLPLTAYPTGRTLVITAKQRDKIARSLSGHVSSMDRGLQLRLARLHVEKFALQFNRVTLSIIGYAYRLLFQFNINRSHTEPPNAELSRPPKDGRP